MYPSKRTRREFMSRSAAAAAGLFLTSCFGDRVSTSPTPRPTYSATKVRAHDTKWPIKRVVYLMLENRSFDNMFGRFPGARGVTEGVRNGREVPLVRCPEWLPGDLPHNTGSWQLSHNGGQMDGFAQGPYGYFAYSQFGRRDIPNYFHWAERYVLGDHFFASVAGPSYPNHLFFIAGQDGGSIDNPENIETRRLDDGRVFKSWGCDAYGEDVFVYVERPDGTIGTHPTCFDFETVGHQLSRRDIDWASYSADPYEAGYIWQAYTSISDIFHDQQLWDEHIWPVDDLLRDIEANALPPVTWVTPRFQLSDHPPFSTKHAHNWVTDIVNAIMLSEMWEDIAIFITWDEWGGLYDHVAPPRLDHRELGFRVPLLVISPYAKRGYIDDAVGEFSSPLRFISDNWDLRYVSDRIEASHDFSHVFDFRADPRPPDPLPHVAATGVFHEFPERFRGWPDWVVPEEVTIRYP
jgi:phospholipase C